MKKVYNAPSMELGLFETADVITISYETTGTTLGAQDTAIPTVDVGQLGL